MARTFAVVWPLLLTAGASPMSSRKKNSHPGIERRILNGGLLVPGFIDVQVNGGGGALLNDNPTIDTVRRIAESHRKFGTTGLLPTVITDAPEVLSKAIAP